MLELGKLYRCEEYHLLLFPDQETASAAVPTAGATASAYAAYWSKRFGKPVSYADKNIPLLVINSKDKCIEVLAGDKTGWIVCNKWLNIKEIV